MLRSILRYSCTPRLVLRNYFFCLTYHGAAQELEQFLDQRKYHESFLQQGGLGVLKGWLEPYHDGTLPNVRVRTAVLKRLQVRHDGGAS